MYARWGTRLLTCTTVRHFVKRHSATRVFLSQTILSRISKNRHRMPSIKSVANWRGVWIYLSTNNRTRLDFFPGENRLDESAIFPVRFDVHVISFFNNPIAISRLQYINNVVLKIIAKNATEWFLFVDDWFLNEFTIYTMAAIEKSTDGAVFVVVIVDNNVITIKIIITQTSKTPEKIDRFIYFFPSIYSSRIFHERFVYSAVLLENKSGFCVRFCV